MTKLERIAEAMDMAREHRFRAMAHVLGPGWLDTVPDYVRDIWVCGRVDDMEDALARWRDVLLCNRCVGTNSKNGCGASDQASGETCLKCGGAVLSNLAIEEAEKLAESWAAERPAPEASPRGWSRHSSGSYWCLHCDATGDAPGDQDCSNCGGLGWRGPVEQPATEVVSEAVAKKIARRGEELRIASGVWDVPKPLGEAKPSDYVFVGLGDVEGVKPELPLLNRKDAERELRRLAALVDSRAYTAPEAMHEIHNSAAQSLNTLARFFGVVR